MKKLLFILLIIPILAISCDISTKNSSKSEESAIEIPQIQEMSDEELYNAINNEIHRATYTRDNDHYYNRVQIYQNELIIRRLENLK